MTLSIEQWAAQLDQLEHHASTIYARIAAREAARGWFGNAAMVETARQNAASVEQLRASLAYALDARPESAAESWAQAERVAQLIADQTERLAQYLSDAALTAAARRLWDDFLEALAAAAYEAAGVVLVVGRAAASRLWPLALGGGLLLWLWRRR